jgi:hypothetical protein
MGNKHSLVVACALSSVALGAVVVASPAHADSWQVLGADEHPRPDEVGPEAEHGKPDKTHYWKHMGTFRGGANGLQQIRVTPDENGDGTADLVVGQPSYFPAGGATQGRLVIISGEDASLIREIPSEHLETFGYSVASLGDINADGRPDYGVGSPVFFTPEGQRSEAGRTWVLRSNALGGYDRTVTTGTQPVGGFFGRAVAWLGGPDQVLANALAKFYGGRLLGLSVTDDTLRYVGSEDAANNDAVSERRGYALFTLGDLDGDGTREVAMSATGQDPANRIFPWPYAGRVYIHNGRTGELIRAIEGPSNNYHFGNAVAEIGDINADGVDDYLVGAYYAAYNGKRLSGSAHIVSGAAVRDFSGGKVLSLSAHPEAVLRLHVGGTSIALLGMSVAALWDLDEDGVRDYAVSAPGVTVNGNGFAGRVYVHSGRTGEVLNTFDGDAPGVWLGEELESNISPEHRLFISTWNADGNAGRVYVYRWK